MGVRQINVNIEVGTGIIKAFERIDIVQLRYNRILYDSKVECSADNVVCYLNRTCEYCGRYGK